MKLMYLIFAFLIFQIGRIFPSSEEVTYSVYTMENIYHITDNHVIDERGNVDTVFSDHSEAMLWLEDISAYESQLQNTNHLQWMIESGKLQIDVYDNTKFDWYDSRYDAAKNASIIYTGRDTSYEIGFTNELDVINGVEHYYFMD